MTVMKEAEINRYLRQTRLPELGELGQQMLSSARVLVAGAGGLGCPVLLYLVSAGVGAIGIVDHDRVEWSNLQRQVLYDEQDVGKPKAETAALKLAARNSDVILHPYNQKLNRTNAIELLKDYDIIVDCTDNFPARYLISDVCALLKKPMVSGSLHRFQGQVSVFHHGSHPVGYRDIFPEPPAENVVPSCDEAGVMGVLPGLIGTVQASEVIKLITGIGDPLSGRMFVIDLKTMETSLIKLEQGADAELKFPVSEEEIRSWDYEDHCGSVSGIPEISAADLPGRSWQLIDVRELNEYVPSTDPDAIRIPLGGLDMRASLLDPQLPTVVFCQSGVRSIKAVALLRDEFGFKEVYSLKGGVNDLIAAGFKDLMVQ